MGGNDTYNLLLHMQQKVANRSKRWVDQARRSWFGGRGGRFADEAKRRLFVGLCRLPGLRVEIRVAICPDVCHGDLDLLVSDRDPVSGQGIVGELLRTAELGRAPVGPLFRP